MVVRAEDDVTAFTITYIKPGEIKTLPRETITLPVFVRNNTSVSRDVLPEIILPKDWRVVLNPMPFTLASMESKLALVTFFVPRGTDAGIHHITYKVSDKNNPAVIDFLLIPIRVLPSYHIIVEHIDAPKNVIAGNTISSGFTIINQGNTDTLVDVQIYSMDNLPYTVIPSGNLQSLTLAPGESQQLNITVETDGSMKDLLEYRLEVKVKVRVGEGVDTGDDQVSDRAFSKTNIIPRISGKAGLFHMLPVMLGIRGESYFNDGFGAGGKISVKSEGSIDENNIHNIKLRIEKAINTTGDLLVTPGDFYFLRYWNPVFDVFLGDYTYYLSPLTEKYILGRGAGASVLLGPFTVGSYYHRDLSSVWDSASGTTEDGLDHVAGYVDFIIPELSYPKGIRYKASLNIYSTLEENLVLGVRQQYRPFQFFNFDLELASGMDFGQESPLGYAVYFDSTGAYKWFSYKLNGVYADPFYPGAYRDLYFVAGTLGFHFLDNRLKINTTYQQQQRNISQNESFFNAYMERNILINSFYSFGKDLTSLSLGWKYQNRIDQSLVPEYLFYDNGIHLTLTQPLDKFTLNIDGEFRYLFDTMNDNDSYHHKYQSSLDYVPDTEQVYTLSLAYNGDYFSDRTDYHRLSVSANYHYALRKLKLDAQIENIYAIQDWNIGYFSLGISFGLTYSLLMDQTLSLNTAYTISSTEGFIGHDAFLILEYKIPFSIPISKKMSIGSLQGSIIDETTGEGVEDVIIHLDGFATVTDTNGRFAFNAIKPGTHYINIDRGGIKKNYIPTARLPMKVEIEKGMKTEVVIGVVEGASVRGQVLLFKENKPQGFLKKADDKESSSSEEFSGSGFPFILLELSNGQDVMRRLSDKHGQFSFDEVLPGKWTLKIVSDNYPEYHYIEKDSFNLDVTQGDLVEIEFKILPEIRVISFLNTEDTLFIRPPDEDMVYELEWKADPTPEATQE
ncbi:MAG: hypothetical protein OQK82_01370, partial [Candidatus Pacearchaeota archaeon]|nr:hypothetical protein [Candidatus Pacearchaeota archaeon]